MTQISRTVLRACHTVLAWEDDWDPLVPSGGVESDTLSPMGTSGEPTASSGEPIVVAAAIVRDGRVLAARRRLPVELAGGWELPGGKVEAGEDERAALVRECAEELDIAVTVGDRLGPDVALPGGGVLRGWVVRLDQTSAEPVAAADHDELRWLAADRLDDVPWLDADRPLITAVRALLEGERLPGGNVGGAVRVGDTVRRPAGPWTPTIHALLEHLRAAGLPGIPEPRGFDDAGREVLGYLPGETVAAGERPAWEWSDSLLVQAMRWLAAYHEAVRDFRPDAQVWRLDPASVAPGQIVCHNDVAPYNVVVDGADSEIRLVGILDWDVSGPGYPIDDVAFAAWNFVPLYEGNIPFYEVARKMELLVSAYGRFSAVEVVRHVPVRMAAGFRRIRRAASLGDVGMRNLVASGRIDENERMLVELEGRMPELSAAL